MIRFLLLLGCLTGAMSMADTRELDSWAPAETRGDFKNAAGEYKYSRTDLLLKGYIDRDLKKAETRIDRKIEKLEKLIDKVEYALTRIDDRFRSADATMESMQHQIGSSRDRIDKIESQETEISISVPGSVFPGPNTMSLSEFAEDIWYFRKDLDYSDVVGARWATSTPESNAERFQRYDELLYTLNGNAPIPVLP